MAKTLSEIYASAKGYRDKYLGLTEKPVENSSKMSVMDAFTWVVSACIWSFDNILDVFQNDVALDLQNRVNGTPAYYANALLKYQAGDSLVMNDDGTAFSYPQVDESKRIITRVSYNEIKEDGFYDSKIVYKVAKGSAGSHERLTDDELLGARAYLKQIAFAGTSLELVSRRGDLLVPKCTVYHDGAITQDKLYQSIETSLDDYIANLTFDGRIYVQAIVDAIQKVDHVVDVSLDGGGIYVAQFDDDDRLIENAGNPLVRVDRYFVPNGGFIKQSSESDSEESVPGWRTTIKLAVEK